jgi:glycosyltransferase involved in cell wall biosynthesis
VTRVAVVIPCHDDGPLAIEAVGSIREPEPVEVVLIDDGSTDPATTRALERLAVDGCRVVRQQNAGPAVARMRGVAETRSRYVFPLDADDLLEPGALAAMADRLDDRAEAGFCWGDYALFGDYDGRYRAPSAWLPWSLTYVNQYPISSLYRRTALTSAGGWQPLGYEDWDLWLRFAELGIGGVPVGRAVYRRRMHGPERRLQSDRRRHRELYAALADRHAELFARRAELRAAERPNRLRRAVYPLLFGRRSVVPYPVEAFLQRTMMRRGLRLSR